MNDARSVNVRADLWPTFAGRGSGSLLEIDAWIPSEISAISPLVERLMRLIEGSHCVTGEETAVELALRETLTRNWPGRASLGRVLTTLVPPRRSGSRRRRPAWGIRRRCRFFPFVTTIEWRCSAQRCATGPKTV